MRPEARTFHPFILRAPHSPKLAPNRAGVLYHSNRNHTFLRRSTWTSNTRLTIFLARPPTRTTPIHSCNTTSPIRRRNRFTQKRHRITTLTRNLPRRTCSNTTTNPTTPPALRSNSRNPDLRTRCPARLRRNTFISPTDPHRFSSRNSTTSTSRSSTTITPGRRNHTFPGWTLASEPHTSTLLLRRLSPRARRQPQRQPNRGTPVPSPPEARCRPDEPPRRLSSHRQSSRHP